MRRISLLILTLTIVLIILPALPQAADKPIRIQGRITDNKGVPIPGNPSVAFEIYDALSGGNRVWPKNGPSLSQPVFTNSAGLFSTEIGPISSDIFKSHNDLYLQISVQDVAKTEVLLPRQKLTSVPFALWSEVSGEADMANSVKDGAITNTKLAPQSISNDKLLNDSVGSNNIKDGNVQNIDLAPDAVTSEKILDHSIQNVDLATDAVRTSNILQRSIVGDRIQAKSLSADEISDGAIGNLQIANDSVNAPKITANSIDSSRIVDGSITNADLMDNTITTTKITSNFAANLVPKGAIMMFFNQCPADYTQNTHFNNRFPLGADVADRDPDIPNRTNKATAWGVGISETDKTAAGITVIFCQKN